MHSAYAVSKVYTNYVRYKSNTGILYVEKNLKNLYVDKKWYVRQSKLNIVNG